jgi:hypothetical protein
VPSIENCDWLNLLPANEYVPPRIASIGEIARYDQIPGSFSGNVRSCSAVRTSLMRGVSSSTGVLPPLTCTD